MGVDIQTYRAKIGTYRHTYGVDVVTLVCVVNFSKGLKSIGCVLFIGILLIIAGVEQNPGPRMSEEACYSDEAQFYSDAVKSDEENNKTKLIVTNLPHGATVETLSRCLERKSRGGKIMEIMHDDGGNSAIVDFEEAAAVDKVMQNQPIIMQGTELHVEVFDKDSRPTKIKVTGLPKRIIEEDLTNYFENEKRKGGGPVKSVIMDKDRRLAVIEFEEASAVEIVMQKQPVVFRGKEVKLQVLGTEDCQSPTTMLKKRKPWKKIKHKMMGLRAFNPTMDDRVDHQTRKLKQSDGTIFFQILEKLGLTEKYPGKISVKDVISIDLSEARQEYVTLSEIPLMMLKRLICAHTDFIEMTELAEKDGKNNIELDNTTFFISDLHEESKTFSPLDIFLVVYQCCDPLMKQICFQKLYLCKRAVPFLYKHWTSKEAHYPVISIWPLRSLAVESRLQSDRSNFKRKEFDLLELKTKVLAFARFGRPQYSKSKLLNYLLTDQGCNTFFNEDCPSGKTPRNLSNGNIEMVWLPTIGNKKDRFEDAMTFLNMRGDINENFNRAIMSFIADFADTVVMFIKTESVLKKAKEVKAVLLNFSSVILVLTDSVRSNEQKIIRSFQTEVVKSLPDMNLRIISTHSGDIERNVVDMVSCISTHIANHLKSNCTKSFEERLTCLKTGTIKTDEQTNICEQGRLEAETLFSQMRKEGESRQWKNLLTPVHSIYSRELGSMMKEKQRAKDFTETINLEAKIKKIHQKQAKSATKAIKPFIDILIRHNNSPFKLKSFLCWIHFYIEREKRKILPELIHENYCAWEKLKTLKSKETIVSSEIEIQETVITDLELKINESSFTVLHFFREIGHIYEAILQLKDIPSKYGLPTVDKIVNVMGQLVADGHQIELINGESFYMPYLWTKAVFQQVDQNLNSSEVMTLSVLGLQSSGKSTLLNTMFGSQFSARTGRCTTGIHAQLVPVKELSCKDHLSPFKYVLVADTEGLRSPELIHDQHEHDNELATVITGIGDVTLLNIMGENTSEVRDILQVIVHAFIRLKMTNSNLDIRKSCAFVHQNVADTSASTKMISGLRRLIQTLDKMTRESARSEGILDINAFNQIIEFDTNSHVWYLKNLWQGNPPMASVNKEYSQKVADIKCKILQHALEMKQKSYKTLEDILEHAYNLWKGVLNEDFVFSFRNSLEIRAYTEMESVVQDELWRLENCMYDKVVDETQNKFASCIQKDKLRRVGDTLITDLNQELTERKSKTEENIKSYFENNRYKDIIIQWKNSQLSFIDDCCYKLSKVIREQTEKHLAKRSVEIFTEASHEKLEMVFSRKSEEVANKYKGKNLDQMKINNLFDGIWRYVSDNVCSTSHSSEWNRKNMQSVFNNYLNNIYKKHSPLLKKVLEMPPLTPLKLGGSFHSTGITEEDVSFQFSLLQRKSFKHIQFEHIKDRVNQILEDVDEKIKIICQVNDEITEMTINKFMYRFDANLHNSLKGNTECNFKIIFYVKVHVHVSRYAQLVFEKHNENYLETHGLAARLKQFRKQQQIRFEAHLCNRKSEDTAADLFCNVIEAFAETWTLQCLPNRVTDMLHSALPCVKHRVIIDICKEFVDNKDFEIIIGYLKDPSVYARLWITGKANMYLFTGKTHAYSNIASALLQTVFQTVEQCVCKLKHKLIGQSTNSMEQWIKEFKDCMKAKEIIMQPKIFLCLEKVGQIQNIGHFTDIVLRNIQASENKLRTKFHEHTSTSVKWENVNPIDRLVKKIWGCSEQCAFCGEPCAKNSNHDGSLHYSIQHRPSCCIGVKDSKTNHASLKSCGFYIKSHTEHDCKVFKYVCNDGKQESCGSLHLYRNYKTYLPNWDIPPTSNMHETSKFWMWVVFQYQKEFENYYGYSIENVPPSWESITADEAKNSLDEIYSA